MQGLSVSVIVTVFILSTGTQGSITSASLQCNRECTKEKLECSNECRMEEEAIDRPEVIGCLRECRLETEECENECACLGLCARELQGCEKSCQSHPFQNDHNKSECLEECSHDAEECKDVCDEQNVRFDTLTLFKFSRFLILK